MSTKSLDPDPVESPPRPTQRPLASPWPMGNAPTRRPHPRRAGALRVGAWLLAAALACAETSCRRPAAAVSATATNVDYYTCSMHPSV
ncbi:MAG: hypothetical protein KGS61_21150, partial [Verrucomicrobia bacterium]|nr:hypothetical protein [Verrucomicrobiota bacterium]